MPMTSQTRTVNPIAAHAVCIAAAVRDLLRTAQFYSRDMSNVDGGLRSDQARPTLPSRFVASLARFADASMTWGANLSISLLLPSWRNLPSPFAPGMAGVLADPARDDRVLRNPLFNAYFFRSAKHIAAHYAEQPNLVLEHRVDAARRSLAAAGLSSGAVDADFAAQLLLSLVESKPVARLGRLKPGNNLPADIDPNVAVFAIAVVALLFAEDGKPRAITDETEYFSIVGALIRPRLAALAAAVGAHDRKRLAEELRAIRELY